MAAKTGKGHAHTWQQARVTLEQKNGRTVAVAVVWGCSGRGCKAETLTRQSIRKPSPNAKPAGDDWLTGLAKRDGAAAARKRRETQGSIADLESAPDLDTLDDLEFEPPVGGKGGGRGTATPEDIENWINQFRPEHHEFLREREKAAGRV